MLKKRIPYIYNPKGFTQNVEGEKEIKVYVCIP